MDKYTQQLRKCLEDILKHDGGAYDLEPRQSNKIMRLLAKKQKPLLAVIDVNGGVAYVNNDETDEGIVVDIRDHD